MKRFATHNFRTVHWVVGVTWALFLAWGPIGAARGQCDPKVTAEFDQLPAVGLASGDTFGNAVAMHAGTAVVGASRDDGGAFVDSGAVRVYVRSGDTWAQQGPVLFASDQTNGAFFGFDVDIDHDTIVAAADGADAAYVFVRSGGSWSEQQKLLPDGVGGFSGFFAMSVAVSGDTIVAGDWLNSDPILQAGAVHVFARSGATWSLQTKLHPDDAGVNQAFGFDVAIDGDTVAATNFSGTAVYVFVRNGTTWSQQAKIEDNYFDGNASIALDGDRLMIGCPNVGSNGTVYFYTRSGSTWSLEDVVAGGFAGERFGNAVDLDGDLAIVGADLYDSTAMDAGRAYVLARIASNWQITSSALAETTDVDDFDFFGKAVAIDCDAALVGAPSDNWMAVNDSGAATFYDLRCDGACCVNGACAIVSVCDCENLGGQYQGPATTCAGVDCGVACCPGDLNGDQSIDGLDVQGLVDALLNDLVCP